MGGFLLGMAAILAMIALIVLVYFAYGAILYFGLPMLGVDITFWQAVVLVVLIATVGALFRGGNGGKQAKGDD